MKKEIYSLFGVTYDFTKTLPIINGVRITTKRDIADYITSFIKSTGVKFYENRPLAILYNYHSVDRSALTSFLRLLITQYSTGDVDNTCYVGNFGFTRSQYADRLYKVTAEFNTRVVNRLLTIDEIAPFVHSMFASRFSPHTIKIG